MATRKKAKGKKAKKKAVKKGARKKVKVTRRAAKKKIVVKKPTKTKAKKTRAAKKIATGPAVAPKSSMDVAPPAGDRIGIVTHYFTHLSVAILRLDSGSLREGDTVHIKGHTSDFHQRVESMELDHAHVSEAHAGQSVGLRVKEHTREHDVVYKV